MVSAPHSHWKSAAFIAGSRLDAITTPLILGDPMKGTAFLAYFRSYLCPRYNSATS